MAALDLWAYFRALGDGEGTPAYWRVYTEQHWDQVSDAIEDRIGLRGPSVFVVTDYGAVGDNSTDSTSAIDAALAAAVTYATTYGGATVYFPAGVYRRSTTLSISTAGIKLAGEGIKTSSLKFTGTSVETGPLLLFTGASQLDGCGITNMDVDGNYLGGQTVSEGCVKCVNTRWFRADNVRVWNSAGYGIHTNTTSSGSVTNTQSNFYSRIYSYANRGSGQHYQSEKNSQFNVLRSELDCSAGTDGTGGIVFEAGATTTIRETTECSITNVRISDSGRFGLIYDGCTKYAFDVGMIHGCEDSGIFFRNSNSTGANSGPINYCTFTSIVLRNNAQTQAYAGWSGIETDGTNTQVNDCTFTGIEVQGTNATTDSPGVFDISGWERSKMIACSVRDAPGTAWHISDGQETDGTANASQDITLISCMATTCGNALSSTNDGVRIDTSAAGSATNISLIGCTLRNDLTDGSPGVEVRVAADAAGIRIVDCDIDAATNGAEISVASGAEDEVFLSGNRWRSSSSFVPSVASAATITVPPEGYNGVLDVTGTADITAITAATAGTTVILKFNDTAGTSGLVDGSNLKLASTLAYTADDTISLVCNGTNWYETGRSVN